MTSDLNLVALLALCGLGALVSGAVMNYLGLRQRRQMALLLERLGEVEARLADVQLADQPATTDSAPKPQSEHPTLEPGADEKLDEGNDPLAGKTSYIRRVVGQARAHTETLAEEALVLVYQHLGETFTASDLADQLSVSLRTLERGVNTAFGCSPRQLITAMKMREARRLLAGGSYRVNEVARQLDFCTPQHFSRRFKSFFGISPKQAGARLS